MFRKLISALVALAVMVSLSITVFADPAGMSMQAGIVPAVSAAPDDSANAFIDQIKTMRDQIKAMRVQLQDEKKLDQKIRSQISSLKNIKEPDKGQIAEYEKQIKALEADLDKLQKDLDKAQKKGEDTSEIQNNINATTATLNDTKAKLQDLLDQADQNTIRRSELKELRKKLQPMYVSLKSRISDAKKLDNEIDKLVTGLKAAIQANNADQAAGITAQIIAKLDALKANIAERMAQRQQMLQIIDSY